MIGKGNTTSRNYRAEILEKYNALPKMPGNYWMATSIINSNELLVQADYFFTGVRKLPNGDMIYYANPVFSSGANPRKFPANEPRWIYVNTSAILYYYNAAKRWVVLSPTEEQALAEKLNPPTPEKETGQAPGPAPAENLPLLNFIKENYLLTGIATAAILLFIVILY